MTKRSATGIPRLRRRSAAQIIAAAIPLASHAPRPYRRPCSRRGGRNGGTVSRWVESVSSGESLADAMRSSRPGLTGMRRTRHPRGVSRLSTNATTAPSSPVSEGIGPGRTRAKRDRGAREETAWRSLRSSPPKRCEAVVPWGVARQPWMRRGAPDPVCTTEISPPLSSFHSPVSTLQFPLSSFHSPVSTLQFPLSSFSGRAAAGPRSSRPRCTLGIACAARAVAPRSTAEPIATDPAGPAWRSRQGITNDTSRFVSQPLDAHRRRRVLHH